MQQFYHYTDEIAYKAIIDSADASGLLLPSGIFRPGTGDIDYGTGWYITSLPPTTSTDDLLWHLWSSNSEKRARTEFWLELTVSELYVTFPDPSRPTVALIPYYRRNPSVDDSAVSVTGQTPALLLAAGGRRTENANGQVEVITLYRPSKEQVVFPSSIVAITGIRSLDWRERQYIRDLYRIDDPDDSFHIEAEKLCDEADILLKRGEFAKALATIEAAIGLDSQVSLAWSNKGAILAALGRREDALAAYKQAIEIDPKHMKAFRNAAASLHRLKRYQEALDMCERALAIEPRDAEVWTNKGAIHADCGNEDAALRAFDMALEIDPGIAQAWRNRGGIIAQRAITASQRVTKEPRAVSELISTAIESYVHAIECNTDYQSARECLRGITGIALGGLPWTWACEDAVWRAVATDDGCLEDFSLRLVKQNLEFHPRYVPVLESEGYDPRDGKALSLIMIEALVVVRTWDWDAEALLGSGRERTQIGTCLLADVLGRCGLAKLAMRLGEIATKVGVGAMVVDDGILLQIAKAIAGAGRNLRRAEAYDRAIEAYQKAHDIYERCGDQKYAAHMTYNIGAAYSWRNGPGDRVRAKAIFNASFEQYSKSGLKGEREAAERDVRKFLELHKGDR